MDFQKFFQCLEYGRKAISQPLERNQSQNKQYQCPLFNLDSKSFQRSME